MKKNLVIGNTSQLSHYFPEDYIFISSREIDYDEILKHEYESTYILFAEQRTFHPMDLNFFSNVNFSYTVEVIDKLKDISERVVIYSTSELWNGYDGAINLGLKHNYDGTPYINSKKWLSDFINLNRKTYKNVIIIYPFNFNSPYRRKGFLFESVFSAIINKEQKTIGNVDFKRDIVHPSIVVRESINASSDKIVGSGILIDVKRFITDLFDIRGLDVNDYIEFKSDNFLTNKRKEYYCGEKYSNYQELINLTNKDINDFISKRHYQ